MRVYYWIWPWAMRSRRGPVLVTLELKLPSSSRTPSDAPAPHALIRPPASSCPPLLISHCSPRHDHFLPLGNPSFPSGHQVRNHDARNLTPRLTFCSFDSESRHLTHP
ncbi:hypothetical protein M405DRAFT_17168 [Rhizopogon salebrosus TDB-379]|nr:hypothetical protein M405DRAFT_17168 [Rhizopogon salebrosus TDB-379]